MISINVKLLVRSNELQLTLFKDPDKHYIIAILKKITAILNNGWYVSMYTLSGCPKNHVNTLCMPSTQIVENRNLSHFKTLIILLLKNLSKEIGIRGNVLS